MNSTMTANTILDIDADIADAVESNMNTHVTKPLFHIFQHHLKKLSNENQSMHRLDITPDCNKRQSYHSLWLKQCTSSSVDVETLCQIMPIVPDTDSHKYVENKIIVVIIGSH